MRNEKGGPIRSLGRYVAPVVFVAFIPIMACSVTVYSAATEIPHRYFLEVDTPGLVVATLKNAHDEGRFVRLLEIDAQRRPLSDTLRAWIQHFGDGELMAPEARSADLVIACYRERQPGFAQAKHVLPDSQGKIYTYMMRGGILVITSAPIPFYDVLMVPDGSVQAYHSR